MARSEYEKRVAFHDEIAPQYDAYLTRSPFDLLARQAFVDLVAHYVPSEATLLDFGCGTGLDAIEYTRRGYKVLAYDNSPGMMAQLERRCGAEIASGSVIAESMDYGLFADQLARWPAPHAAVANFAVFNLIADPEHLFDTFARYLAPPGWVVISILNPLHWSKVTTASWWRNTLWQQSGPRAYVTEPYRAYLHFEHSVLRAARRFRLVGRANAGKRVRFDPVHDGDGRRMWWGDAKLSPLERVMWQSAAYRLLGHFTFLVLRRDPQ